MVLEEEDWTHLVLRLWTWLGKLENPTQLPSFFLIIGFAAAAPFATPLGA